MTDKVQLIKQEIERIEQILDDFNKTHNNTIDNGIVSAKKNICKQIKSFIDSLPEEPKKQPKFKVGDKIKFKVAIAENIVRVITDIKETGDGSYMYYFSDGYIHSVSDEEIELVKESINTDLEEEIKRYIQSEFPDGIGFPNVPKIARYFAEWQKQYMMKGAIECNVHQCEVNGIKLDGVEILSDGLILDEKIFKDGDKVKIIIVKEE